MSIIDEREFLNRLVKKASEQKGLKMGIVEKDLFVCIILKEIKYRCPNIVFKGGTSLSKCYKLINRFSEDIDLSCSKKLSQKEIKNINHEIINICDEFEFDIINKENIKSGLDFNRFIVDFHSMYNEYGINQYIIIETSFGVPSIPSVKKQCSNYVFDFIEENDLLEFVQFSEIYPFQINVQTLERTFADKIFALCDYHISGKIKAHSRHLYDIYHIYPIVKDNSELKSLIKVVREERKANKHCHSAINDLNINDLLNELINKETYKRDYNDITAKLIFDDVKYDDTINTIKEIISKEYFI